MYPGARAVAPRVAAFFREHARDAVGAEFDAALLPDVSTLERLIDAAFWTSLRREEGYVPRISLALLPAERARDPLRFERPLPLAAASLARIAPAVERPGIHLGVSTIDGELLVWGTTRHIPTFALVLEVSAPGMLVIKHHRGGERRKFVNVAVLEADRVKVVDEYASSLPDCPDLLAALGSFAQSAAWDGSGNVFVQLAVSMRAHGRGGLLLVLPENDEGWRESIVQPPMYGIAPAFAELAVLVRRREEAWQDSSWDDELARSVSSVAGLTAVDGATVMTRGGDLLAFGAKITRRRGSAPVTQVTVTEPIEGSVAEVVDPGQLGGTRHLSAAQFVHDQRSAVALVASQDGRFTVFAWSPCENMVHAHRVETLLV